MDACKRCIACMCSPVSRLHCPEVIGGFKSCSVRDVRDFVYLRCGQLGVFVDCESLAIPLKT